MGKLVGAILCKPYKLGSLDHNDSVTLQSFYHKLYPDVGESSFKMSGLYKKLSSVTIHGEDYGSEMHSRRRQYGRIMPSWCDSQGDLNPCRSRRGIVRHFMVHSIDIDKEQLIHVFAVVKWFKPAVTGFAYGNPLSV